MRNGRFPGSESEYLRRELSHRSFIRQTPLVVVVLRKVSEVLRAAFIAGLFAHCELTYQVQINRGPAAGCGGIRMLTPCGAEILCTVRR